MIKVLPFWARGPPPQRHSSVKSHKKSDVSGAWPLHVDGVPFRRQHRPSQESSMYCQSSKDALWQCTSTGEVIKSSKRPSGTASGWRLSLNRRGARPWQVQQFTTTGELHRQFLLDAYGGETQVARSSRTLGLPAHVFDISRREQYNLHEQTQVGSFVA